MRAIRVTTWGILTSLSIVLLLATPARAIASSVLLSDTTDLTPGTSISATVNDPSGNLCDQSYGVGEWSLYLEWFYPDTSGTVVGHSVAQSLQSSAYVANEPGVWSANFFVVWLKDSSAPTPQTWNGSYQVRVGCSTPTGIGDIADGLATDHTGTFSDPVNVTYQPVTVSANEIPQGETISVTVTDSTQRWCNFTTGSGYSMGVWLDGVNPSTPDITIPNNLASGGVPGVGSFTWANASVSVDVVIPEDIEPGLYTLRASCVEVGPTFVRSLYAAEYGDVTITQSGPGPTPPTPPLPNTGVDMVTLQLLGLLSVVAGMFFVTTTALRRRRRV